MVVDKMDSGIAFATYDGRTLQVQWPEAFMSERRTFRVSYRVEQPLDGLHFNQPNEPLFAVTGRSPHR